MAWFVLSLAKVMSYRVRIFLLPIMIISNKYWFTPAGADLKIWRPQADKRLPSFPRNVIKYSNLKELRQFQN